MSVTIKSYRKERQAEILNGLQKGLERAGLLVERQAKINVSQTTGHPQVQDGHLKRNIIYEVGDGEVTIGTNVKYGKYLEFGFIQKPGLYIPELNRVTKGGQVGPYPWLFPALEEKKPEIIKALKGDFTYTAEF